MATTVTVVESKRPASEAHAPRVLVVDVDDDLRTAICDVLSYAGFRSTSVPDVASARSKLLTALADVLLVCWDAHATTEEKTALIDYVPDRTAVVLMSTDPTVATIAAGFGVPFITKPFDLDEFLAVIERSSRPPPQR